MSDADGPIATRLRVVDWSPSAWFLLADGEALYLDVNCSHGFVGYSWLIALDEDERARYHAEGRSYLDRLAEEVDRGVPLLAQSRSPYRTRDLSRLLGPAVTAAVAGWRANS